MRLRHQGGQYLARGMEPVYWSNKVDSTHDLYDNYTLGSYQNNSYNILAHTGFGYDHEFQIYEINSNSWRIIDATLDFKLGYIGRGVSLKGKTYWIASGEEEKRLGKFLISFDYTTERFERLCLPNKYPCYATLALSVVREEKLSMLSQRGIKSKAEIWVTNKIGETQVVSWSMVLALDLQPKRCIGESGSFLVDEKKRVVVCCDNIRDQGKTTFDSNLPRYHRQKKKGRMIIVFDVESMRLPVTVKATKPSFLVIWIRYSSAASSPTVSLNPSGRLQQTLAGSVEVKGKSLHSGKFSTVKLNPEIAGAGRFFEFRSRFIPASIEFAQESPLCTTLLKDELKIRTVEHLLSALEAKGVDNCRIQIESESSDDREVEVSKEWVDAIQGVGINAAQNHDGESVEKMVAHVNKPVYVCKNDTFVAAFPALETRITCGIDFPQVPAIGCQWFSWRPIHESSFAKDIASSRTFCVYEEVERMREAGLIKGGSLDNAIVCSAEHGWMNPPLRFDDEACRHKILDLIGDLSLVSRGGNGGLPVAHIVAYKNEEEEVRSSTEENENVRSSTEENEYVRSSTEAGRGEDPHEDSDNISESGAIHLQIMERFNQRSGSGKEEEEDTMDLSIKQVDLLNQVEISRVYHCDGLLLCVAKDNSRVVVWNPYLGQTRWIRPRTESNIGDSYALGYDINRNHKILRMVQTRNVSVYRYEIYDLRSNSWRVLEVTPNGEMDPNHPLYGVSVKGNTYFFAHEDSSSGEIDEDGDIIDLEDFLLCFDFTTETFGLRLPLPFHSTIDATVTLSCVRDQQLAVLYHNEGLHSDDRFTTVEFWVTTSIEPNSVSWSKFLTVDMRPLALTGVRFDNDMGATFFIDEDEKVAVVFDLDGYLSTESARYHTAFISGKDGFFKPVTLGVAPNVGEPCPRTGHIPTTYRPPLVCSSTYLPSLVQVNQQRKRKERHV
ncbi:F5A9.8 [Arabidopsis thaliana]|nr:F5A9.8 [Arabidopsis thaliana]